MSDNDVFSKYSLDNILEEAKMYSGETQSRIWSMQEIDALLEGEDYTSHKSDEAVKETASKPKNSHFEEAAEPIKPIKIDERVEKIEPKEPVEKDEGFSINFDEIDFDDDENDKDDIKTEKDDDNDKFSLDFSGFDDDEFNDLMSSFESEEQSEIKLKESAIINAIKNPIDIKANSSDEVLPEKPLVDGTVPDFGEKQQDITGENKNSAENVSGQISIEKTRVFNEVNARAVHSDDIHHNIGEKVIHTSRDGINIPQGKGLETNKYRERFLNKPKLQMEKTLDHEKLAASKPPKVIEKYGVFVRKPDGVKTSEDGLMPMPTIVAADDELKVLHQGQMDLHTGELKSFVLQNNIEEERNSEQIKLDGFESEDRPQEVDEYETEIDLINKRREKAGKFRLFPNLSPNDDEDNEDDYYNETDDSDESEPQRKTDFNILGDLQDDEFEDEEGPEEKTSHKKLRKEASHNIGEIRIAREYYSEKDAEAVLKIMRSANKKSKLKAVVLAVIGAVLTAADLSVPLVGDYKVFGGSALVFVGVNLACLLLAAIIEFKEIGDLFKSFKTKNFGRSSVVCSALFAGILQSAAAFFYINNIENGTHIYAPVVFLPLVLIAIGDAIKNKNDITNLKYLTENPKSLYSVSKVDDDNEAFEIGRGLLLGDPDIRYSSKIAFPSKFVEMTKRRVPENDLLGLAAPAVFIAAAVIAAVTGFVFKDIFTAISAFTGVVILGLPMSAVLSSADILKSSNKKLAEDNSFVSGYSAVDDAVRANAVVIDASDLFLYGGCNIYGIKPLHSMRIDEAILYTAAVIIQSGGTLCDVFDRIILSKREILPHVESLAYEEKLGCSGWINNQRVLVGNRELLANHNVEVPEKSVEEKYKTNGRQVLYLAVEGKTAALFVVGYKPNNNTGKYLNKLEKYGVSVLVRTTDPNITESMIEQYFDLPRNFVKIINPVAGKLFKKLYDTEKPKDTCGIIHDGKVDTLLRAFLSVFAIHDKIKISTVLQCIGIGIGILVEALLSFTSGLSQAGVLQILIFEIVWTLLVIFIPKLKRI